MTVPVDKIVERLAFTAPLRPLTMVASPGRGRR